MSNTEALRAAAQQALDAMNYSGMDVGKFNRINAACRALREALTASTHASDVSKSGAETNMTAASGEPVAHVGDLIIQVRERVTAQGILNTAPLYTAHPAPARVPLTDDQIAALVRAKGVPAGYDAICILAARAAERTHGITAKEAPAAAPDAQKGEPTNDRIQPRR